MDTPAKHASLAQRAESYWAESQRPLASLIFIAPWLIVYETGVLLFGVQNGADVFMRRVLDLFGFGQHLLLPFLVVCILLGWHYLSRRPWQLSGGVISAMAVESLLLGFCLRLIGYVHNTVLTLSIGERVKEAISFLGAGIYEELLFRLILLSLLAWAFRTAKLSPRASLILAVAISSLLFAAAHHVGPYGEPWRWAPFLFRTMAGAFFSAVFLYRGFGIAAGSHAAYDVLVGVL